MTGLVAIFVCVLVTLGLSWLDREPKVRPSIALWIPTIWMFIASSRNISEWLESGPSNTGDSYLEGSPLDRNILTAILAMGLIVVIARREKVWNILRSNTPILLYFFYCGLSVLWSDFPDVSFKRWFRALGDVLMVLIILSDANWLAAFRRILARLGFLVLPLSILFIRYFPDLGRRYSRFTGQAFWVGVATDKNALGMISLVFGLAALYRFIQLYEEPKGRRNRKALFAQGALIAMTLYLIKEANSATALSCFGLAGGVLIATSVSRLARKPVIMHALVFAGLAVAFSALFLGIGTNLVEDLGRNTTLTGRTNIWLYALPMVHNSLIGTGFESFWIGPRRDQMMVSIDQSVNQAHNGYIEVYLNLGWIGLVLLAGLIVTGYRRVSTAVRLQMQAGSLRMAYIIVAIAYNFTEGGFKMMHPVWILFLLSIAVVPKVPRSRGLKIGAQFGSEKSPANSAVSEHDSAQPKITTPDLATTPKGPAWNRRWGKAVRQKFSPAWLPV
jgi:O-antigen ligase